MDENKCHRCDTELKVHCGKFCPKCYDCKSETLTYYDWFRVMHHLETEYGGIKNRLWNHMCDMGVINDVYMWVSLKGNGNSIDRQLDLARLAAAIGLKKDETGAFFNISW